MTKMDDELPCSAGGRTTSGGRWIGVGCVGRLSIPAG